MTEPNQPRSTPSEETDLPSRLAAVLADDRRARALSALACAPFSRTFDDLVTDVAIEECQNTGTWAWTAVEADVAVSLHHAHLPSLEAEGLLEHDVDDRLVELTAAGRECAALLDLDVEPDSSG